MTEKNKVKFPLEGIECKNFKILLKGEIYYGQKQRTIERCGCLAEVT